MDSLNQEEKKLTPTSKKNIGQKVVALALLGLALALLLFFVIQEQEVEDYTPEDLFTANFSLYPNETFPVDKNLQEPTLENTAFLLYDQADFSAAIAAFDTLVQTTPQDDYRFYQSIIQIATDQNSDALINLSQIVESEQTRFKPQAEWYLALSYLKIGADDAAKPLLEKLAAQDGGFQSGRSRAILEMLKE